MVDPPRNGRENRDRRQPGRPTGERQPGARAALLEAASRLFAARGVEGVSLRRIADEAGVTPAMVHYYFGSKEGLHEAMLERTFARIIGRARAVAGRGEGLPGLLRVWTDAFGEEPWIPTIVLREVLSEGGRFRERFIEDYASHMAALLPSLIRDEMKAGHFREDLDPTLAFLSFLGMTIMPFVARPVVEEVVGLAYDEAFLRRFAEHTHKLFVQGARA